MTRNDTSTEGEITSEKLAASSKPGAEKLRHSQRLALAAEFARGLAHDLSNPLQGIGNYAELIRRIAGESSELGDFASEILNESDRVTRTTLGLLTFIRAQSAPPKIVTVARLVEEARQLVLHWLSSESVAFEVSEQAREHAALVRGAELQQVLVNLFCEARRALNARFPSPSPEKKIRVSVSTHTSPRFETEMVRVSVEYPSTGVSIPPPSHLELVMDQSGPGSDSPMFISRGIAQEHGGELSVENGSDARTRFHLDLPRQKTP